MIELTLAALVFVVSHIGLSHGGIRAALVARLGLWPHRLVYSLISIAALAWMVMAYTDAPHVLLFDPHMALKHLPLSLMMFASLLIVGGYSIANPSAIVLEDLKPGDGIAGILKITRAPVMWGVGIFAFSHMLANADTASWIFFGALLVLAIAGGWHLDQRKQAEGGQKWLELCEETSFWPLAAMLSRRTKLRVGDIGWWRLVLTCALYAGILAGHKMVLGVTAFPLPV
ncbi:MAG: NnrU protein [Rhodospirillaceae bacterium]|jgi:uncharacterized membrane protein|nr:NnrU protein [Rhodospirillaceae bacterium]MBT5243401.1 NnrU protein [Rhodospirillaceae bacterium]MBT5561306.1 NnrU protein [Rhodospirillaceae bacterium]MBT6243381.1 NnrU protein [Rhodospirillaceae bacterium]MBT7138999.1 NnrU protein [Rhodospirillaceae bacterium]